MHRIVSPFEQYLCGLFFGCGWQETVQRKSKAAPVVWIPPPAISRQLAALLDHAQAELVSHKRSICMLSVSLGLNVIRASAKLPSNGFSLSVHTVECIRLDMAENRLDCCHRALANERLDQPSKVMGMQRSNNCTSLWQCTAEACYH